MPAAKKFRASPSAETEQQPESDPVAAVLDRAVEQARSELDAARAEVEREQSNQSELQAAVAAAQQAFDDDPSDTNADRLLDAKRTAERGALYGARATRRAAEAESRLQAAERARLEAELDFLEQQADSRAIAARIQEAVERARPAVALLIELDKEVGRIVSDAGTAVRKATELRERLHGASLDPQYRIMGINNMLRAHGRMLRDAVPGEDRKHLEFLEVFR